MRHLILICLLLSIFSCEKDTIVLNDCLKDKLEALEMIPYENQEINCEFYVEMFVYLENQYFQIGSHCADVEFNLQNCWGNQVCSDLESTFCKEFFDHAERIGIVGITE